MEKKCSSTSSRLLPHRCSETREGGRIRKFLINLRNLSYPRCLPLSCCLLFPHTHTHNVLRCVEILHTRNTVKQDGNVQCLQKSQSFSKRWNHRRHVTTPLMLSNIFKKQHVGGVFSHTGQKDRNKSMNENDKCG